LSWLFFKLFKYFLEDLHVGRMLALRKFLTRKEIMFTILVFAFVGVIAAWGFEIFTYSGGSAPTYDGKLVVDPFEFTITTEKATYKLQERVKMNVTLRNIGEENVTFTFSMRPNPNPYWFWRVYDRNQQVVFYYEHLTLLQATQRVTLQPGEFMQRECAWDQKATNSGQQVPPGIYYLTAATGFMCRGKEVKLETQLRVLIEF